MVSQRREEGAESHAVRAIPEIEVPAEVLIPAYSNYISMTQNPNEVILTFCAVISRPTVTVGVAAELSNVAQHRVLLTRGTATALTRMLVRELLGEEAERNLTSVE